MVTTVQRGMLLASLALGFVACAAAQEYTALPAYVLKVEDQVRVKGAVVKTEKELDTETDGGGALTLYSKAGKPIKMILEIGLSNRDLVRTFYYVKGILVLCVDRNRFFKWDAEKQERDPANTSEQTEERYYYKNGALVCWLTVHDPVSNESDTAPEAGEKQCLEDSSFFLKVAASKEKTVDVSQYITGKP